MAHLLHFQTNFLKLVFATLLTTQTLPLFHYHGGTNSDAVVPIGYCHALSTTTPSKWQNPASMEHSSKPLIRRVAIIGSGIAGLSTAHALVSPALTGLSSTASPSSPLVPRPQVTLFDSRPKLDGPVSGAGVQLNGGLAALKLIDPNVQQAVINAGLFQGTVRSRAKAWSSSTSSSFDTLLELSLKDVIRKAGGAASASLIEKDQLLWITIMRGALQEALFETLPKDDNDQPLVKVQFSKQLVGLQGIQQSNNKTESNNDSGILCQFSDGTASGPFDLVIGCDGIKSAVKEFVHKGSISSDASKREGVAAGLYTGIRIRYAVQEEKDQKWEKVPTSKDADPVTLTQYFGDGAYCLSGIYGTGPNRPRTKCAFIIFLDPDYIGPYKKRKNIEAGVTSAVVKTTALRENADWSQDVQEVAERSRQTMLQQLRDCGIPPDELQPVIENADRFFELGVYAHNPFCEWSKQVPGSGGAYAVLCGDAAHALPPFLGQGSNQAIQDAYSLGLHIRQYNEMISRSNNNLDDDSTAIQLGTFLKQYESIRWPANFQIFWKASFLGYLETGGANGFYAKFRDIFFKTMGLIGVAQRVLVDAATPKLK